MSRLIDGEALQQQLQKKRAGVANERYTDGFNDAMLKFKSMIHGAPTVDAVEVVRCDECMFINRSPCPARDCQTGATKNCMSWCCIGKRKESEATNDQH